MSVNQAFYFLVGESTCRGNMQHRVQLSVSKSVRQKLFITYVVV